MKHAITNNTSDLINAFVDRWAASQELYVKPCTVTYVDTSTYTIDVLAKDNSGDINGVKLKVYATGGNDDFFIPVPAVGSNVIVAFEGPSTAVCLHADKCDVFYLNAGTINVKAETVNATAGTINADADSVNLDAGQTTINGGANFGLINILDLTAKLNELVVKVNEIIAKFNTHNHDNNVPPPLPNEQVLIPALPFIQAQYEDTKVTH